MKRNVNSKKVNAVTTAMRERFAKAYTMALKLIVSLALHVTMHAGKLEGIQSVSTLSVCNPFCLARMADNDSVCSHCYVQSHAYKTSLMAHLIANYIRLQKDLPNDALPIITSRYGRIESFGDTASVTQSHNYNRLIEKNSDVKFAIFSKNHDIWAKVFDMFGKPNNACFVLSSDRTNVIADIPKHIAKYVDYVFTVFDFDYATTHNIHINCGFRKCVQCGHCYNRGGTVYVNEILKSDAKRYEAWLKSKVA